MSIIRRVTGMCATLLFAANSSAAQTANGRSELDDAKAFLTSQPEIKQLAPKFASAVKQLGAGLYQVPVGVVTPPLDIYLVKQPQGWTAVLWLRNASTFTMSAFVPDDVIGRPAFKSVFAVIAAAAGSFDPGVLPASDLKTAMQHSLALVPRPSIGQGVNVVTVLTAGDKGVFGQLKTRGVLPGDVLMVGAISRGFSDQLFTASGLPPSESPSTAVTLSLTASAAGFVPAPFTQIASPKLTFGAFSLSITKSSAGLTLAGSQLNSTLLVGTTPIRIPSTTFQFVKTGTGYSVAIEGKTDTQIQNAFGINGVALRSIGVRGTFSSEQSTDDTTKTIRGFGLGVFASVSINGAAPTVGSFTATMIDGKLSDLFLDLSGSQSLAFTGLPNGADFVFTKFGLGVNPASGAGYLLGALNWKSTQGQAAVVVVGGRPAVFLEVKGLDLASLLNSSALASLPRFDDAVVMLSAMDAAAALASLPLPVQNMIASATGITTGSVQLVQGPSVVTRLDASKLTGANGLNVAGPLVLGGSFNLSPPTLSLLASYPQFASPSIKGFQIRSPQLAVSLSNPNMVPTLGVGIQMGMTAPLTGDPGKPLSFTGLLMASTDGSLSLTGSMDSDWNNPLGLANITILKPAVISLGVGVDASFDIGLQGGARIGSLEYRENAVCVNLQVTPTPPPTLVAKAIAMRLSASQFGLGAQVQLMQALVASVNDGPMKSISDPDVTRMRSNVRAVSDTLGKMVTNLPIAQFAFNDALVYLQTPGVRCKLPALATGMGVALRGTAVFAGNELGVLDSYLNLKDGLKLFSVINPFKLGPAGSPLLTVTSDTLDVLVLLPGNPAFALTNPGHFKIKGISSILDRPPSSIEVRFDNTQASFDLAADLADLGSVGMLATTVGPDLAHVSDFKLALRAKSDVQTKLFTKFGQALKATSAARRQGTAALISANSQALRDARTTFTQLDAGVGKQIRAAQATLKQANATYNAKTKELNADLAGCAKLEAVLARPACELTFNALKLTVSAAKDANTNASSALDVLNQSRDGVRWASAQATIAEKNATATTLQHINKGWDVLDGAASSFSRGVAPKLITLDNFAYDGSLAKASGTLTVAVSVGGKAVTPASVYRFDLRPIGRQAVLDVTKQTEVIADEVQRQAQDAGSAVAKAFKG